MFCFGFSGLPTQTKKGAYMDYLTRREGRDATLLPSCPDSFHCCPVQFWPTGRTACVSEGFRRIEWLGTRIWAHRRLPRRRSLCRPAFPHHVMPGLVPGIHVLRHRAVSGDKRGGGPTWMPGTSPGMTVGGEACRRRPAPPDIVPAHRRKARAKKSKPDSSGLVPGMTVGKNGATEGTGQPDGSGGREMAKRRWSRSSIRSKQEP